MNKFIKSMIEKAKENPQRVCFPESYSADILKTAAEVVRTLHGWEPRVAMLAFSTTGSAEHETIDVVREAVQKVHELRLDIKCDGEFQLDSAIIP